MVYTGLSCTQNLQFGNTATHTIILILSIVYLRRLIRDLWSGNMDAIKKKMQAMKVEKDNAMDRSDACEQAAKDAKVRYEGRRGTV